MFKIIPCLLQLMRKRRLKETVQEQSGFKVEKDTLNITFTLSKKLIKLAISKRSIKETMLSDPLPNPI